MFEKFSGAARETVIMAQAEARSLHHDHIGTEHLLLGLLHDSGVAGRVLAWHGLQLPQLRDALTRIVGTGEIDAQALASLGIDLDEVRRRVEANFGEGALDRPAGRGRRIGCNHIRSPRRPRRPWNSPCGRPWSARTATSAPSTSCSA